MPDTMSESSPRSARLTRRTQFMPAANTPVSNLTIHDAREAPPATLRTTANSGSHLQEETPVIYETPPRAILTSPISVSSRTPATNSNSSVSYHRDLEAWMVIIEYRADPSLGLSDPATKRIEFRLSTMLEDKYTGVDTKDIRAGHVSLNKVNDHVRRWLGFRLDFNECELGYVTAAPLPGLRDAYHKVTSELTFRNAVSVLFNAARELKQAPKVTLHLWNPIPSEPVFRHSRRARNTTQQKMQLSATTSKLPDASLKTPTEVNTPQTKSPTPAEISSQVLTSESSIHSVPPLPTIEDDDEGYDSDVDFDPTSLEKKTAPSGSQPTKPKQGLNESKEDFDNRMHEYIRERDRLQYLKIGDADICNHLDLEIWREVCRLFHHDPLGVQPEWQVKVFGFGRMLLPVQAHGVWYTLRQIHGLLGGVFLCHAMGIGKTTMAFCVHWIQHVINYLWAEVAKYPEKHVSQEDANSKDLDLKCPSAAELKMRFGFDCPCAASSPTNFIKRRPGVSVALVPTALLDTWSREHKMCFQVENPIFERPQVLARAHGSKGVTIEQWTILRGQETKNTTEEHVTTSTWRPRLQNGECFVLSTPDSMIPQFLRHQKNVDTKTWQHQPEGVRTWSEPKQVWYISKPKPQLRSAPPSQAVIISLLFRDEFHLRPSVTSAAVENAQTLQNKHLEGKPRAGWGIKRFFRIATVWMSGTPLSKGPGDMAPFVKLMVRECWRNDDVLKHWMGTELKGFGQVWDDHCTNKPNPDGAAYVLKIVQPLVEKILIRFTLDSLFLGQRVVRVPSNKFEHIVCHHSQYWTTESKRQAQREIDEFEKRERDRKAKWLKDGKKAKDYQALLQDTVNQYYKSRLCASFPFLETLRDEDGKLLRLTGEEWDENTRAQDGRPPRWIPGETDPYFKNLDAIVSSSGKLVELKRKLDLFKWPEFKDGEDKPSRHIFLSYFPVAVHILKMWFLHHLHVDPRDIITITGSLGTQNKRTKELDRFHVDLESKVAVEKQRTARFILSTSSAITVGLTLAEAVSVGFLEPDFRAHVMAQGYSRHWRQGNVNWNGVHSWLFTAKDNAVEKRIMDVNRLREGIKEVQTRKVETPVVMDSVMVADGDKS